MIVKGSELSLARIRKILKIELKLVNETAFRIGSGEIGIEPAAVDNAIMRSNGEPFIPGTTLKGVFRSAVEALTGDEECELHDNKKADKKEKARFIRKLDNDEEIKICRACWLFGNGFIMGRVNFNDAYVEGDYSIKVRDGVMIDRETETAKEGLKYDFEVVEPSAVFKTEITIINPAEGDEEIIDRVLDLINAGIVKIGGLKSRGLGKFRVLERKKTWIKG